MDPTIDQRVRAVLSRELGLSESAIASDATLKADLGADSVDSYNLVLALEEEFSIEIPDDALPNLQTVRQVIDFVQRHDDTAAT